MISRSFLLLQGVATPFFTELGKALEKSGHRVLRINFSGGDLFSGRYFSIGLKHINFRGKPEELADFYQQVFTQHQITDVLLFGDTRPVHYEAIKRCKDSNIRLYVYEEGYLRPNWVTLDKGGVNAYSSLPKDPNWYLQYATEHKLGEPDNVSVGGSLAIRAWHDIRYHFFNLLLHYYFPYYESHRPERALKEYWGWIKRFPMLWLYLNKQSRKKVEKLLNDDAPYYLLPLQLDADSQIRVHSPFKNLSEVIQNSMASFANNAPKDSKLVIKIHPLDPWFTDFEHLMNQEAAKWQINPQRLVYLESGDLNALLEKARGTVLVNSTVGTSALTRGCPVIALGEAIYDMPGLTFQGTLDQFWTQAQPPNKALFNAFRSSIIDLCQINGCFYYRKGIDYVVRGSLAYFEREQARENETEPEKARKKGQKEGKL